MDREFIKFCIRRLFDYFVVCTILSVLMVLLNHSEIVEETKIVKVMMFLGAILFIIENIRMLRGCYYALKNDKVYLIVNISVYIVFALITYAFYWLAPKIIFTWLFAVTRFGEFVFEPMKTSISIAIFHIIQLIIIFIAPTGMNWVFKEVYENFENEEDY